MSVTRPITSPTTIHPASEQYRHSSSGEYLAVGVPKYVSELGIDAGDNLYLYPGEDRESETELLYVGATADSTLATAQRASWSPRIHTLKLRSAERDPPLFVRLPIEYTAHNSNSPFYKAEIGDEVSVEVRMSTSEFRIYPSEAYGRRLKHLVATEEVPDIRLPIFMGVPFVEQLVDDQTFDFAAGTPHASQCFELSFFNGSHQSFLDEALRQQKYVDKTPESGGEPFRTLVCDEAVFKAVLERRSLPRVSTSIGITWYPTEQEEKVLYFSVTTGPLTVYLPADGAFSIGYGNPHPITDALSGKKATRPIQNDVFSIRHLPDEKAWVNLERKNERLTQQKYKKMDDNWGVQALFSKQVSNSIYHLYGPIPSSVTAVTKPNRIGVAWVSDAEAYIQYKKNVRTL